VCLFCSTTGLAFGPVFASEFDANDFLEWMTEQAEANGVSSSDPRDLGNAELAIAYGKWQARDVVEA
jgi:tRNA G26 N,N-dimethylase Trm1